jgi:hypothetical protein
MTPSEMQLEQAKSKGKLTADELESVMVDAPTSDFEIRAAMSPRDKKAGKARPCKRLGKGATTEALHEAHREKMRRKAERRAAWYAQDKKQKVRVQPNLSRRHPNRNKSIQEAYS